MRLAPALLFVAAAAFGQGVPDERYQALIHELRCLVCQNQSLAESNAPLAEDLRRQVRDQIAAGRSNEEIVQYLTARYGDFVLYRPPVKPGTWLLWFGPFLVLAAALAAVAMLMRRSKSEAAAVADPETVKRLLEDRQP